MWLHGEFSSFMSYPIDAWRSPPWPEMPSVCLSVPLRLLTCTIIIFIWWQRARKGEEEHFRVTGDQLLLFSLFVHPVIESCSLPSLSGCLLLQPRQSLVLFLRLFPPFTRLPWITHSWIFLGSSQRMCIGAQHTLTIRVRFTWGWWFNLLLMLFFFLILSLSCVCVSSAKV